MYNPDDVLNEKGTFENIKPNGRQKKPEKNEVEMICMSDVEMQPISWLWNDRIACGKLTVIAGNPGLGKSQTVINIAATVTKGGEWPEACAPAPQGSVIILSAEDDPGDTIKPRLVAAGADVGRVHVLRAVRITINGKPGERGFDLTQDVERLGAEIEKIGDVRLVIIDPISAYLGDTESNNNSKMRGLLAPLAAMAEKYKVAMLLVTHLNKSKEQDMIGRVIGSIGLIAAARAGYAVIKDDAKPEIRYFVPLKNNIGNDRDGFAFCIKGVTLEQDIKTSKIQWHGDVVNAQKILYPEKKTQTNGAKDFLQEILQNGPKLANEVYEEGEGAGYSKRCLQRAAIGVGVRHKKRGMTGPWEWRLEGSAVGGEDVEGAEDVEHDINP